MLIAGQQRASNLALCLKASPHFLLNEAEAIALINHRLDTVHGHSEEVCNEAALGTVDRNLLRRRQFLNPLHIRRVAGRIAAAGTLRSGAEDQASLRSPDVFSAIVGRENRSEAAFRMPQEVKRTRSAPSIRSRAQALLHGAI